jgi:hypothetical protein
LVKQACERFWIAKFETKLKRVKKDRDIVKGRKELWQQSKVSYDFIREHQHEF